MRGIESEARGKMPKLTGGRGFQRKCKQNYQARCTIGEEAVELKGNAVVLVMW